MDENTSKRIHLLMAPAELAAVNRWRCQYPALSQSDAIKRLIDLGLVQVAAQPVPAGEAELAISDGKPNIKVPIAAPDQAFLDGIRGRNDVFKGKIVRISEFQNNQIKQLSRAMGIHEREIIEDAIRLYMTRGVPKTGMAP
jgi:hypothetical protein